MNYRVNRSEWITRANRYLRLHWPIVNFVVKEQNRLKKQLAIIGASGFIGLRAHEVFASDEKYEVRALVRSVSSLSVLARNSTRWRVTNFVSPSQLADALSGCVACVHCAIGDPVQIVKMAKASYAACAEAGVRRLIWLSSASVHGQNPEHDADEESLLNDEHPIAYNNAKVRAEWELQKCQKDGKVEVIRLRPSIVYGPRSRWISDAAEAIIKGDAGWVDKGRGRCNTVYVDDLVEAIALALSVENAAGNAFLIGDEEHLTWRKFLLPIADYLGKGEDAFRESELNVFNLKSDGLSAKLMSSEMYNRMAKVVPYRAKRVFKSVVGGWREPYCEETSWKNRHEGKATLSQEMGLLFKCDWTLSSAKAARVLGYAPRFSFENGMRRCISWLRFLD